MLANAPDQGIEGAIARFTQHVLPPGTGQDTSALLLYVGTALRTQDEEEMHTLALMYVNGDGVAACRICERLCASSCRRDNKLMFSTCYVSRALERLTGVIEGPFAQSVLNRPAMNNVLGFVRNHMGDPSLLYQALRCVSFRDLGSFCSTPYPPK